MRKSLTVILVVCVLGLNAQTKFTQFFASPLLYNPAMTGRFNKSYRIGGAYRNERNTAGIFSNGSIFFDTKILKSIVPKNDCFAIGVLGSFEKGNSGDFTNNSLGTSIGYQKGLDEEGTQQIGIGFQTIFAQRQLRTSNLLYESQIQSLLNSGYSFDNLFNPSGFNTTFFDLNVGAVFQGKIKERSRYSIGASILHAMKPTVRFAGGSFVLLPEFNTHAGFETSLNKSDVMYFAALISFNSNKSNELTVGGVFKKEFKKSNNLLLGVWVKNSMISGSAIVPNLGLTYKSFVLNLSYDIFFNKVNGRLNASEISLISTNAISRIQYLENKFITY